MGLNLKGALAGLGQGMQVFGKVYGDNAAAEEERELQREKMQKAEEIEAKRFKAQREDARMRNEQLKTQTMINRMKYDNDQMSKAAIQTQFDPEKLIPTLNNNSNTGYAFRYNAAASDVLTEQNLDGEQGYAYDVGVWKKDAEGNPLTDDNGKKIFMPLPGDSKLQTWQNKADFTNWYSDLANPSMMWARYQNEQSNEQILKKAEAMEKIKDETKRAQAEMGLQKARTEEIQGKKDSPKEGQSWYRASSGEKRYQNSQDVEKAKQFAAALNKSGKFKKTLSADDGARIMDIENNDAAQKVIGQYLNTLTEEQFKEKFSSGTSKLPPEYIQRIWNEGHKINTEDDADESSMWDRLKSWVDSMIVKD